MTPAADPAVVGAIVRDLQQLLRRYKAAGKLMEAKAIDRAIEVARHHRFDPPDQATRHDRTPMATMAPAGQIQRL